MIYKVKYRRASVGISEDMCEYYYGDSALAVLATLHYEFDDKALAAVASDMFTFTELKIDGEYLDTINSGGDWMYSDLTIEKVDHNRVDGLKRNFFIRTTMDDLKSMTKADIIKCLKGDSVMDTYPQAEVSAHTILIEKDLIPDANPLA